MKYLYRYKVSEQIDEVNKDEAVCLDTFTPSLQGGVILPGERAEFRTKMVRLMFWLLTGGKAKIVYLQSEGKPIHTSYVIPKCFKFGFMNRDDYEIGPCFTDPEHRGRGIYPNVLRSICKNTGNKDTVFYMIVDETNTASIRGIEKAGFVRCGSVKVNKLTKRYTRIKEERKEKLQ